jgi:small subunit ribosomal protein S20
MRSALKTRVRRVLTATDAKDVGTAEQELRVTATKLDQAGAQGLIHPNKAARLKSRLQKRIKSLK